MSMGDVVLCPSRLSCSLRSPSGLDCRPLEGTHVPFIFKCMDFGYVRQFRNYSQPRSWTSLLSSPVTFLIKLHYATILLSPGPWLIEGGVRSESWSKLPPKCEEVGYNPGQNRSKSSILAKRSDNCPGQTSGGTKNLWQWTTRKPTMPVTERV
ncbi:hypothetical protein JAAARDRAFT_641529 [Jaapia argillacea MUCL 33604]|uniref:Uncharacterized protein n=1 Tax=Jaapia argillacea MUCL 33604 TaxID=933084 RepID=A0A067P6S7_9AGAM|nr:hypothetical protein JAAARDRAFT_641529 [Jaapia argillacea MUCL 33604]